MWNIVHFALKHTVRVESAQPASQPAVHTANRPGIHPSPAHQPSDAITSQIRMFGYSFSCPACLTVPHVTDWVLWMRLLLLLVVPAWPDRRLLLFAAISILLMIWQHFSHQKKKKNKPKYARVDISVQPKSEPMRLTVFRFSFWNIPLVALCHGKTATTFRK